MILAFPFAFKGLETADHVGQARLFVGMVRRFIPGTTVVQVTDMATREIEGVDDCFRIEGGRLGEWYFHAMLNMPYPQFLRVDYDVVIREDVGHVFDHSFDIAIAKESKGGVMNNGVVFVKNKLFFEEAVKQYQFTTKDGWNDIQNAMQAAIDTGLFGVRKLDPRVYNCVDEPFDGTKIIHFKGPRKSQMSDYRVVQELA